MDRDEKKESKKRRVGRWRTGRQGWWGMGKGEPFPWENGRYRIWD